MENSRKSTRGGIASKVNDELEDLLQRYQGLFKEELPEGLPARQSLDHAIETEEGGKPPMRQLYQLSPAELLAVREYFVELLRKGKKRRSKCPYGASLFFVKNKDSLRVVVYYRALNRLTKRNHSTAFRYFFLHKCLQKKAINGMFFN